MNTTDDDILEVQGINSKGFGIIPKLIMQDTNLTATAKAIYAFFCSYAGAGQQAFPKQKTILHYLDLSEATYYRHFNLLKKYGYIKTRQTKDNRSKFSKTIYTLVQNPTPAEEEIPHPKFEGTEIECTQIECTQNKGDYINNKVIQSTEYYYNHQSISQQPKTDKTDIISQNLIDDIKIQIEYTYFAENFTSQIKLVDTLISIIAEMKTSPVTVIGKIKYSKTSLEPFIADIDAVIVLEFIEHILLSSPASRIKNPTAYYKTSFFNYIRDNQLLLAGAK